LLIAVISFLRFVLRAAERRDVRSHAERGNESLGRTTHDFLDSCGDAWNCRGRLFSFQRERLKETTFRAAITRNGGEKRGEDW
jgi:hypothetical protein